VATARKSSQISHAPTATEDNAWIKTARAWAAVRDTMRKLRLSADSKRQALKVQLAFLEQARAAYRAWEKTMKQRCNL